MNSQNLLLVFSSCFSILCFCLFGITFHTETIFQVFDLSAVRPSDFVHYGLSCLERLADQGDNCAKTTREKMRIVVCAWWFYKEYPVLCTFNFPFPLDNLWNLAAFSTKSVTAFSLLLAELFAILVTCHRPYNLCNITALYFPCRLLGVMVQLAGC
jgi:hypothetical protein